MAPRITHLVLLLVLIACASASLSRARYAQHGSSHTHPPSAGPLPPPLILSDYLDRPSTARKLSQVTLPGYEHRSYSGLFTVRNDTQSNMFFWFFEAETNSASAPVLLWLQGGPGASSLYGLFCENGPFKVDPSGKSLLPNVYRWTQKYNVLYVDNPVGVGFSFTQSVQGYVKGEEEVGNLMLSFLKQFFTVFPDHRKNNFYVVGESYGGKYAPSVAYTIHEHNIIHPLDALPLTGVAIGDGLVDPRFQMVGYSELFFNAGLTDIQETAVVCHYEDEITTALHKGDNVAAFRAFDEMLNGDFYAYPTYFYNVTGIQGYFNLLNPQYASNPYPTFLNLEATRVALHVGDLAYNSYNSTVEFHLIGDWMRGVSEKLSVLLNHGVNVLVYSGQLDLILAAPQTERYIHELTWKGKEAYRKAEKAVWKVDNTDYQVAGYIKRAANLAHAVVRSAGHMVPMDQPRAALDLITRFVSSSWPK